MRPAVGRALARAALAGNPSDGFGGATLATTLTAWSAVAEVRPAPFARAEPAAAGPLIDAALDRFAGHTGRTLPPLSVRVESTIPLHVGLGGSSAIVIAVLRAVAAGVGDRLGPEEIALLALAAETEDLGIAAGPQDRVVQAHGGLVLMDFAAGVSVERLDPGLLPPLLVAHRAIGGRPSGDGHAELRRRRGEVGRTMAELGRLAHQACRALARGDCATFAACLDGSLELRASVMPLDPAEAEGASIARMHGAAVNYAGSGGAVVSTIPSGGAEALLGAWRRAGWRARRLT